MTRKGFTKLEFIIQEVLASDLPRDTRLNEFIDFITEFKVTPHEDGAVLRVTQDGFPADSGADDFYAACETGWKDTFVGIRRYLENSAG